MPYASAKQQAFMHIEHPEIAKKWDKEQKKSGKPFPKKEHEHADRGMSDEDSAKHWKKTGMQVPKSQAEQHKK